MAARQVTVVVDGRPYIIEFDDVSARPMNVRVNGRLFVVEVSGDLAVGTAPPAGEPFAPADVPARPAPGSGPTQAPSPGASPARKTITAPMPGNILDIFVQPGDEVKYKQDLCMLEAMKMKNVIRSPHHGVIAEVKVQPGRAVSYGEVLFVLR